MSHPIRRHDEVVDNRRYNLPERAADDYADGHVDSVALYGELFELID